MKIYLDGRILNAAEAVISPFDHGFLYGLGLFETMRSYGGKPALFTEHYKRLTAAAEEIGIAVTMSEAELTSAVLRTLAANDLTDAYIRLNLTAGQADLGPTSDIYETPGWLIFARPLPAFSVQLYQTGKILQVLNTRRNSPEGSWRFKSHHYMNNRLAKREIGSNPLVEGLFLTNEDFIAEGIVSNVFFVNDGVLYTPSLAAGILPGTRRAFVMELAYKQGWKVEEGLYRIEDIIRADEVFITNAIQEIVPIHTIRDVTDGHPVNDYVVGKGTIGPVTARLLALYRERLR
ncbi:aminodeoxychorismate lyase [Aneurinibacillus terranovensis]|uniref:aminodeoxychorismate lyase n=1 Tax=Aneurinibacillus terranovensis TaxID=278991 RepID=UPI0004130A46|nr:aminodeoxychorismate lyase [Aneurinibacillus terranovensis]